MPKLYTSTSCAKCLIVKRQLSSSNIKYKEYDIEDENVLTDLISRGITVQSVPILELEGKFYYTLEEIITALILGEK